MAFWTRHYAISTRKYPYDPRHYPRVASLVAAYSADLHEASEQLLVRRLAAVRPTGRVVAMRAHAAAAAANRRSRDAQRKALEGVRDEPMQNGCMQPLCIARHAARSCARRTERTANVRTRAVANAEGRRGEHDHPFEAPKGMRGVSQNEGR